MKTHVTNFRMRFLSIIMGTGMLTLSAFAGGTVQFHPVEDESAKAVLVLELEADQGSIRISIEDEHNSLVYFSDHQSRIQEYRKRFDFSSLSDGTYYIVTSIDGEEISKQFKIINSKLHITENTTSDFEAPVLKREGEYLLVLHNNLVDGRTLINFSANDEVFFSDELAGGKQIRRKYDLGQLPAGEYELDVFLNSKMYSYPVIVK